MTNVCGRFTPDIADCLSARKLGLDTLAAKPKYTQEISKLSATRTGIKEQVSRCLVQYGKESLTGGRTQGMCVLMRRSASSRRFDCGRGHMLLRFMQRRI